MLERGSSLPTDLVGGGGGTPQESLGEGAVEEGLLQGVVGEGRGEEEEEEERRRCV